MIRPGRGVGGLADFLVVELFKKQYCTFILGDSVVGRQERVLNAIAAVDQFKMR